MTDQQSDQGSAVEDVDRQHVHEQPLGRAEFQLADFSDTLPAFAVPTIQAARDEQLEVRIELGRTLMRLKDSRALKRSSVVPLNQRAGDPVEICVNGRLFARGEVVVLNQNVGVRITELVASAATA